MNEDAGKPRRQTLPRTLRLRGKLVYNDIFQNGFRQSRGPITALARANDVGHPRMGLAVPGRVGIAARRNRIKRLIRESFRLMQHDHTMGGRGGYDLIVLVRPHAPLQLAEYQKILSALVVKLLGMIKQQSKDKPSRDESPSS